MAAMADDRRDDNPDATEAYEPVSGESAPDSGEETAFLGHGDETSVLPPSAAPEGPAPEGPGSGDTERLAPEPRWAARAGVPPAGTRPRRGPMDTPTEQ